MSSSPENAGLTPGASDTLTIEEDDPGDASLDYFMVGMDTVRADADGDFEHSVADTIGQVTVSAMAMHMDASARITSPADADNSMAGHQVDLGAAGDTTDVMAEVTAGDGSTKKTYTLAIERKPVPPATAGIVVSTDSIPLTEGDSTIYRVSLATMPEASVAVTVTAVTGLMVREIGGTDALTATVTFAPSNYNVPQGVWVTADEIDGAFDDAILELSHAAASTDEDYGGATPKTKLVKVNVANDDAEGAAVAVTPTSLPITEGDTLSFGVSLGAGTNDGRPLSNVTVTIKVPSASAGAVRLDKSRLIFTRDNFRTVQRVLVTATEDDIDLDKDDVVLELEAKGGGYDDIVAAAGGVDDVTVDITDDDTAGVTVSATALQVMEGETGTYTIKLNSDPGDEAVTITAASGAGATATVSPRSVDFNSTDWDRPKTFTVRTVDDTVTVGTNPTATIAHTILAAPAGNGYSQGTVTGGSVEVTVVDDETAQAMVTPTALTIKKGAQGTYTVRLTQAPGDGETVTLTVKAAAGLNIISSAVTTFTAGNWNRKTVEVGVPESTDVTAEGAAGLVVTNTLSTTETTSGEGYEGEEASNVTVTVAKK